MVLNQKAKDYIPMSMRGSKEYYALDQPNHNGMIFVGLKPIRRTICTYVHKDDLFYISNRYKHL